MENLLFVIVFSVLVVFYGAWAYYTWRRGNRRMRAFIDDVKSVIMAQDNVRDGCIEGMKRCIGEEGIVSYGVFMALRAVMDKYDEGLFEGFRGLPAGGAEYIIGVDNYSPTDGAYCLMRRVSGGRPEVLLSKREIDSRHFDLEVQELAKYFNAVIVKDV